MNTRKLPEKLAVALAEAEQTTQVHLRRVAFDPASPVNLLADRFWEAVLEQNPGTDWKSLLGEISVTKDEGGAADLALETEIVAASPTGANSDDEFAKFKL